MKVDRMGNEEDIVVEVVMNNGLGDNDVDMVINIVDAEDCDDMAA